MIEIKDIEKLAELSRINISSEETQTFRKDIESILSYVDQLKMVDAATDKAAPREEGGIKNVFREDENYHDSGQFTEALLELAPEKRKWLCKGQKKIPLNSRPWGLRSNFQVRKLELKTCNLKTIT